MDRLTDLYDDNAHRLEGLEWGDFCVLVDRAWDKVQKTSGKGNLGVALEETESFPLPPVPDRFTPAQKRLVALCAYLSEQSRPKPFYLAQSGVAEVFGIDQATASRWLSLLILCKIIEVVKAGQRGKATEYLYLGWKQEPACPF